MKARTAAQPSLCQARAGHPRREHDANWYAKPTRSTESDADRAPANRTNPYHGAGERVHPDCRGIDRDASARCRRQKRDKRTSVPTDSTARGGCRAEVPQRRMVASANKVRRADEPPVKRSSTTDANAPMRRLFRREPASRARHRLRRRRQEVADEQPAKCGKERRERRGTSSTLSTYAAERRQPMPGDGDPSAPASHAAPAAVPGIGRAHGRISSTATSPPLGEQPEQRTSCRRRPPLPCVSHRDYLCFSLRRPHDYRRRRCNHGRVVMG